MNGLINKADISGDITALTSSDTTYYQFMNPSQYQQSYYIDRNGFRFFSMAIKCNSPKNDWYVLGDRLYQTQYFTLYPPFAVDTDTGATLPMLIQNGSLYVKGGTAGKIYDISFMIPI